MNNQKKNSSSLDPNDQVWTKIQKDLQEFENQVYEMALFVYSSFHRKLIHDFVSERKIYSHRSFGINTDRFLIVYKNEKFFNNELKILKFLTDAQTKKKVLFSYKSEEPKHIFKYFPLKIQFLTFVFDETTQEKNFENFSSDERNQLNEFADEYNLFHESRGDLSKRFVFVSKGNSNLKNGPMKTISKITQPEDQQEKKMEKENNNISMDEDSQPRSPPNYTSDDSEKGNEFLESFTQDSDEDNFEMASPLPPISDEFCLSPLPLTQPETSNDEQPIAEEFQSLESPRLNSSSNGDDLIVSTNKRERSVLKSFHDSFIIDRNLKLDSIENLIKNDTKRKFPCQIKLWTGDLVIKSKSTRKSLSKITLVNHFYNNAEFIKLVKESISNLEELVIDETTKLNSINLKGYSKFGAFYLLEQLPIKAHLLKNEICLKFKLRISSNSFLDFIFLPTSILDKIKGFKGEIETLYWISLIVGKIEQ
eukprot:gene2730-3925_t